MIPLLRQVALLAIAAVASWWLFLADSTIAMPPLPLHEPDPLDLAVLPSVPLPPAIAEPVPAPEPTPAEPEEDSAPPEPIAEDPDELAAEDQPPPSEAGEPEGSEEAEAQRSQVELMADGDLREEARQEMSGEVRMGFATVLLAAPEEQLGIARHFGEELVLVPRAALDRGRQGAQHFRVDAAGEVAAVAGLPPLESYRQYRDLFEYEYARLPEALRALRRSVLSRDEIFLFAALIPLEEWALVVGRRQMALQRAGRQQDEVRRFVLEYERASAGGFDLRVEEIVFTDGTRFVPPGISGDETP